MPYNIKKSSARKKLFNKYRCYINKNIPMVLFNTNIDEKICEIRQGGSKNVEKIFQKYKKEYENEIQPTVALTLIDYGLKHPDAIKLLDNSNKVLQSYVLTLERPYADETILYAIKGVQRLPLKSLSSIVDLNFLHERAINRILPFAIEEIIENPLYNFLLGKTSNSKRMKEYIQSGIFSQEQLRIICENILLPDEIREIAFDLLDDIYSVKVLTDKMKECLFNSAVETYYLEESTKMSVNVNYVKSAGEYLNLSTSDPETYLNEKLEFNLIKKCIKYKLETSNQYLKNLIINSENPNTLERIMYHTGKMTSAMAASKSCSPDGIGILNNFFAEIIDLLKTKKSISNFENAFKYILDNQEAVNAIDYKDMLILSNLCNKPDTIPLSRNLLYFLSANAYVKTDIISYLSRACINDDIMKIAQANLIIRETKLTKEEQHQLLQCFMTIMNEKADMDELFFDQRLTIPTIGRITLDTYTLKKDTLKIKKCTHSDYKKIMEAINILTNSTTTKINRKKTAFKSVKEYIKKCEKRFKTDNSSNVVKYSDEYLEETFYELRSKLKNARNEMEVYYFFQDYGKTFDKLHKEVEKRCLLYDSSIDTTILA